MTQAQLIRRHNLPATSFDVLEWKVEPPFTAYDGVERHFLQWKVPAKFFFLKPTCFKKNVLSGEIAVIEHYEVSLETAAAMNTHDYTRSSWGHSVTFHPREGGVRGTMLGFGDGVENGHYLLIRNGTGSTRYQVQTIKYYRDPADMWSAEVVFAPRPSPQICQ